MWMKANLPHETSRRVEKLVTRLQTKIQQLENSRKHKQKIFDCQKLSRRHNAFRSVRYHTAVKREEIAQIFIKFSQSYFQGCAKFTKYLNIAHKIAKSILKIKSTNRLTNQNSNIFVQAKI